MNRKACPSHRRALRRKLGGGQVVAAFLLVWFNSSPGKPAHAAERIVLTPIAVAAIEAPEGGSRILLSLPDLSFLSGQDVLGASIAFSVPRPTRLTTFELRPILTDWSPGTPTWNSPWTAPGGDISTGASARFTFFPSGHSEGEVLIDAGSIFRAFADEAIANRGLILKPLGDEGDGYDDSIRGALSSNAAFRIEIRYADAE